MLFTAAKITHLNVLPQGQPERDERTLNMVIRAAFHGHREPLVVRGAPLHPAHEGT